jgi:hypothetical protein
VLRKSCAVTRGLYWPIAIFHDADFSLPIFCESPAPHRCLGAFSQGSSAVLRGHFRVAPLLVLLQASLPRTPSPLKSAPMDLRAWRHGVDLSFYAV